MSEITTASEIKKGYKFKILGGKQKGDILFCLGISIYKADYKFYDIAGDSVDISLANNRKVELLDDGYIPMDKLRQWEFVKLDGVECQVVEIVKNKPNKSITLISGETTRSINIKSDKQPIRRIYKPHYNYIQHIVDNKELAEFIYVLLDSADGTWNERTLLRSFLESYSVAIKSGASKVQIASKTKAIDTLLKVLLWEEYNLRGYIDILKHFNYTYSE